MSLPFRKTRVTLLLMRMSISSFCRTSVIATETSSSSRANRRGASSTTETSLPKRLNELAILIEARLWDAQYEWWAHYPIALKAGVPEAVANDIKEGRRPTTMKPDEEVVYDVCIELLRDRHLTDATFKRAKATLG